MRIIIIGLAVFLCSCSSGGPDEIFEATPDAVKPPLALATTDGAAVLSNSSDANGSLTASTTDAQPSLGAANPDSTAEGSPTDQTDNETTSSGTLNPTLAAETAESAISNNQPFTVQAPETELGEGQAPQLPTPDLLSNAANPSQAKIELPTPQVTESSSTSNENETNREDDNSLVDSGNNEPPIDSSPDLSTDHFPDGDNYEDLLTSSGRIGFGANATGGFASELCLVTNLSDSGTGSLRECIEKAGANWIRFSVSGTINSSGYIYLNSNKTIDGRGADITLSGEQGLICFGKENIIIHNIKIKNIGSGIKLREQCKNVWIDHVELSYVEDEALSADQGSTDITFSRVHVHSTVKAALIGSAPDQTETRNTRVTIHNSILAARMRNPNSRYASVHVFNNVIENFQWEGMVASQEARIISENNVLIAGQDTVEERYAQIAQIHNQGDYNTGYLWSVGDDFRNGADQSGEGINPDTSMKFDIPYHYPLDLADDALIERLRSEVGWQ